MKIVNKPKKSVQPQQEFVQLNETVLSLAQALESLHEGFKDLSMKFEVASNLLSVSKEEFSKIVNEVRDSNFDSQFAESTKDKQLLQNGEEVLDGDVVVAQLFNKEGEPIFNRILVNVGEEFYGEIVKADFKVGDMVNFSLGFFKALKAVRL